MPWDGPTFSTYYARIGDIVREKLMKEKPEFLLEVDPDEYLDYLVSDASWQPFEWDTTQMTIEPYVAKNQVPDSRTGRAHTVEQERAKLRIPLAPHPRRKEYLKFGPSTYRYEDDYRFEGDTLVLDVEMSDAAVKKALDKLYFWWGGRNHDIAEGNAKLRDIIKPVWEQRRKGLEAKLGARQQLLKSLNIPLHRDPNAPARPITIMPRQAPRVVQKPSVGARQPEPVLSRDDVIALVDFIEQYARQFEITPVVYAAFEEEQLRDLLIGMLNANYPGGATGESFSKLGKVDITLRVSSGHVLICECKFWGGAKLYLDSIAQLFRYPTWRPTYGVLIHFCRLRDMTKAVAAAKEAVAGDRTFVAGSILVQAETSFTSRHTHPQDADKTVEIHHLLVDLSLPR